MHVLADYLGDMLKLKAQIGVSMIEASLAIPVLLLLVFAGIDALRFGYAYSAARYAIAEAANWASKADSIVGVPNNKQMLKNKVREFGSKSGVEIAEESISICSTKNNTCENYVDITPGELFTIRIAQPFGFITLMGLGGNLKTDASGKASNT